MTSDNYTGQYVAELLKDMRSLKSRKDWVAYRVRLRELRDYLKDLQSSIESDLDFLTE